MSATKRGVEDAGIDDSVVPAKHVKKGMTVTTSSADRDLDACSNYWRAAHRKTREIQHKTPTGSEFRQSHSQPTGKIVAQWGLLTFCHASHYHDDGLGRCRLQV